MLKCAVLGATGFAGSELTKILLGHPRVQISLLTTSQDKEISLRDIIPTLPKDVKLQVVPYDFSEVKAKSDVAFLCLPHTEAMASVEQLVNAGKVVIDLSADFRLKDKTVYEKWYAVRHTAAKFLSKAVYGLSEINRNKIKTANLIANPGCYPTGPSLALVPLLENKLIKPETIIINAASGVSGAGKKPTAATHYCEVNENYSAYKVNKHQHTPEIEQTLSNAAGKPVNITFIPHLLPVYRGILATIYAEATIKGTEEAMLKTLNNFYKNDAFVRIKSAGGFPTLKDVQRTNFCDIGVSVQSSTKRAVIIVAIDNLIKGAAGQAVQNMNIRFGFPETTGLLSA